MSVELF